MSRTRSDVLVILPAWNEEESLPGTLRDIKAECSNVDVLVVDDGSSDGTSMIARASGARVLTLPFNVGVGGGVRAGLLFAHRRGYTAAVQCDADGQHPGAAIPLLLESLDRFDIVIGARFAGVGDYRVRGPRKWAMKLLSAVLSKLHGTELTDTTSGFRAFGPAAIETLSREMPPEYLGDTLDALVIAKQHGLLVHQVPVEMRARQGGNASHGPFKAGVFLLRAFFILGLSFSRLFFRKRVNS